MCCTHWSTPQMAKIKSKGQPTQSRPRFQNATPAAGSVSVQVLAVMPQVAPPIWLPKQRAVVVGEPPGRERGQRDAQRGGFGQRHAGSADKRAVAQGADGSRRLPNACMTRASIKLLEAGHSAVDDQVVVNSDHTTMPDWRLRTEASWHTEEGAAMQYLRPIAPCRVRALDAHKQPADRVVQLPPQSGHRKQAWLLCDRCAEARAARCMLICASGTFSSPRPRLLLDGAIRAGNDRDIDKDAVQVQRLAPCAASHVSL